MYHAESLTLAIGFPSGWEWPAIIFIILLLFGAKKLPELARGIGKSLAEFRKAREEFTREIEEADRDTSDELINGKSVEGTIAQPRPKTSIQDDVPKVT